MSVLDAVGDVELPPATRDAIAEDRIPAAVGDAGRVLEATTPYLELLGFTRAELEAGDMSWMRLTPPASLTADARGIGEARATGRARPYAKCYVRRDGTEVPVVISLRLLQIEPLRVVAVVAEEGDDAVLAFVEALGAAPG
jgi:PAS domain S-box-containing protein